MCRAKLVQLLRQIKKSFAASPRPGKRGRGPEKTYSDLSILYVVS